MGKSVGEGDQSGQGARLWDLLGGAAGTRTAAGVELAQAQARARMECAAAQRQADLSAIQRAQAEAQNQAQAAHLLNMSTCSVQGFGNWVPDWLRQIGGSLQAQATSPVAEPEVKESEKEQAKPDVCSFCHTGAAVAGVPEPICDRCSREGKHLPSEYEKAIQDPLARREWEGLHGKWNQWP